MAPQAIITGEDNDILIGPIIARADSTPAVVAFNDASLEIAMFVGPTGTDIKASLVGAAGDYWWREASPAGQGMHLLRVPDEVAAAINDGLSFLVVGYSDDVYPFKIAMNSAIVDMTQLEKLITMLTASDVSRGLLADISVDSSNDLITKSWEDFDLRVVGSTLTVYEADGVTERATKTLTRAELDAITEMIPV